MSVHQLHPEISKPLDRMSGPACRDYLDGLALKAEEAGNDSSSHGVSYLWDEVRSALSHCIELTFDELGTAAERFLAAVEWQTRPYLALALARLAHREARIFEQLSIDFADSLLLIEELRAVAALDISISIAVDKAQYSSFREGEPSERIQRLSENPDYAAFAETALREAARRVRRIHDRELPYASDKAFTPRESDVVDRLMRVALARDESWLPPVLDELFRRVSIAPTAAKTLPSQSVAIALSHAVGAFPTPEAVATLRAVLRDIRHAGVKKKLQRDLGGAERGLADRPEIALRLPPGQPVSKQQLTTLARSLEAGLATGMVLAYDDWRVRLAEHPQAKALACSLIWRILDGGGGDLAVLPAIERGGFSLRNVSGALVSVAENARVRLWHPCETTAAEREGWRDRLATLRIKQPFKQVFREYYTVSADELAGSETTAFAGHAVSVRSFLGLARRERWQLEYDSLTRAFGGWTVELGVADNIYPGQGGGTTTGKLRLWGPRGQKPLPARLGDLPPATLSEILRSVDLLVSVSGFAVTDESDRPSNDARLWHLAGLPLDAMAEMRKQALRHALRGVDGAADLQFDPRHLRIGSYAVHLATGRVTRDGDPVTVDLPQRTKLSAVPWLPYDEKLLETIYYTAIEIMGRDMSAKEGGNER